MILNCPFPIISRNEVNFLHPDTTASQRKALLSPAQSAAAPDDQKFQFANHYITALILGINRFPRNILRRELGCSECTPLRTSAGIASSQSPASMNGAPTVRNGSVPALPKDCSSNRQVPDKSGRSPEWVYWATWEPRASRSH